MSNRRTDRLPLMQPNVENLLRQAAEHFNQSRMIEAARTFETVLDAEPAHPEAAFYLGLIRYQEDDYMAAKDLLKIAARKGRKYIRARLYLGFSLNYLGELDRDRDPGQR